jgi:hypothetical protein
MLTPLYRALCVAALRRDGVFEPSVSATGCFRDESGDLLQADDGVALILQALAFADATTGATIGREVVKALAKQCRVERLEARYDVERSSGHAVISDDVIDALHDAARDLAAQRSIEAQ